MEPITLSTGRLLLRTVGPNDAETVLAAVQDPGIRRWISPLPSPYLREHADKFIGQIVPDGWATDSMYTFGVFLSGGELAGMLSVTTHAPGVGEVGFWAVREHRGHGYITEAMLAAARWAFAELSIDRLEWRAEVGNAASRAVAERVGFTIEGVLRAAISNQGVRRDCWTGSLLPSDLDLPSTAPYLPAPGRDQAKPRSTPRCQCQRLSSEP